jgi:hypothetical protein
MPIMRHMLLLAAFVLALALAACDDTPTTTTSVELGLTTVEKIQANTGYATWYEPGYATYPADNYQGTFDQQVNQINQAMDSNAHKVVMVIKPTCSCQKTQMYFPQAMKTLDEAGFPRQNIEIWVTDARLNGIDSLKNALSVTEAPSFILLKNGVVVGRIGEDPAFGSTIDKDLAALFTKQ